MTDIAGLCPPLATIPTMKSRARRLRAGQDMKHAEALETVAHRAGCRDWNTAAALAPRQRTMQGLAEGDRVAGTYLGHFFEARILELTSSFAGGVHRVKLRFDTPVDVIASDYYSSYRQQIRMEINDDGTSDAKTSDGTPHLVLEL